MLTESLIFAMLVMSSEILLHLKKRTPVYIRVSEASLVSHARFSPTVNRWINSFDTSLLMAYMGLPVDSSIVTSSYTGLDTCVSLSRYEILTVLFTPSRGWIVCQIWVEETWEIKRVQERHRDMAERPYVCAPHNHPTPSQHYPKPD